MYDDDGDTDQLEEESLFQQQRYKPVDNALFSVD